MPAPRTALTQPAQCLPLGDGDELPRLGILGRAGQPPGVDDTLDILTTDRTIRELAYRPVGPNRLIHFHSRLLLLSARGSPCAARRMMGPRAAASAPPRRCGAASRSRWRRSARRRDSSAAPPPDSSPC